MQKAKIVAVRDLSPSARKQMIKDILSRKVPAVGFSWTEETLENQSILDQSSVIYCEEEPAAMVVWKSVVPDAEILSLITAPQYRKRGLMTELLKYVFGTNSQIQTWWLEVHEANIEALNLYKKLGFEIQGSRPKYYPDGARAMIFKRTITT